MILQYPMGTFLLSAAMFLAGGLNQGLQSPLFNLPGDILGKELGSTGAGIMDGWMYVGATFAGVFLGWWLDTYGLLSGIVLMAVVSFVSGLLNQCCALQARNLRHGTLRGLEQNNPYRLLTCIGLAKSGRQDLNLRPLRPE